MAYDRKENELDIRMVVGIQNNIKIIKDTVALKGMDNINILNSLRNIGIAVSYLSHNCKIYDRTIPWKSWVGLFQRIIRKDEIDMDIIKDTVANDIPILETFCTEYLEANVKLVQGLLYKDNNDNLGWILDRMVLEELHNYGVVEDNYYTKLLDKFSNISTNGYTENEFDICMVVGIQNNIKIINDTVALKGMDSKIIQDNINILCSLRNIGIAISRLSHNCKMYDQTIPWESWVRLSDKILVKSEKIDTEIRRFIATDDESVLEKRCKEYLKERLSCLIMRKSLLPYEEIEMENMWDAVWKAVAHIYRLETFCTEYLEANAELVQDLKNDNDNDDLGQILEQKVWNRLYGHIVENNYSNMLKKLIDKQKLKDINYNKSALLEYVKPFGYEDCIFFPSYRVNINDIELVIGMRYCIRQINEIIRIPSLQRLVKDTSLNDDTMINVEGKDISLTTIRDIMFTNLRNIGIAALDLSCKGYDPSIPWNAWIILYRQIIHNKELSLELAWDIATNDVPQLKNFCMKYIRENYHIIKNIRVNFDYDDKRFKHIIKHIITRDLNESKYVDQHKQ